jgi:hypothetical protein
MFVAALSLGVATLASAQTVVDSGTIVRIDPQSSVVVLDDGRMYRVTPSTVFLVENRATAFTTLRPGTRVVVRSAEPVVYREGQYIALQTPGTVVAGPPPSVAPPTVIAQAPPSPSGLAVPLGVRQTIYGTIQDVDRDGKVKIKTDRDSFEARFGPEATRQIKKGDNVVIDLTISPPGSPAALPR